MNEILEKVSWLPHPIKLTTSEVEGNYLRQAYYHSSVMSPDPSTKNGAILVDKDGVMLAYGVNKFPKGIAETESRLVDKKTKYRLVVHAENGAVFNAAKHGRRVEGSTLYCPFYSCTECAKAIIQSGIIRVVGHAQLMSLASEHTIWTESIIHAWNMLHEAGIQCDLYDGILDITTRFNGQDISV